MREFLLKLLLGNNAKPEVKKKKPKSLIKEFLDNPDSFTYSMKVNKESKEIIMTFKKNEEASE